MGLTNAEIDELMAGTRAKGAYAKALIDFIENSDDAGVNPRDVWPADFKNKTAGAMVQSFKLHIEKADLKDVVLVLRREDDVYLIHKGRYSKA